MSSITKMHGTMNIKLICIFVACTEGWLCELETALYTFR